MNNDLNSKQYDLEDRTYRFAVSCRDFVRKLPRTISNIEYGKQLIRSSGSQAANYIEANEALSKKDFCYRIRICRKETKESCLWINLSVINEDRALGATQKNLLEEATQLRKIFSSILNKSL